VLEMSKHEIEHEYTHAKCRASQIKILAELNATHPFEICNVLVDRGVLESREGTMTGHYVVLRLLKEGYEDDIIEKLDVSKRNIEKIKSMYENVMNYVHSSDYKRRTFEELTKNYKKSKRSSISKSKVQEEIRNLKEEYEKKISKYEKELEDAYEVIRVLRLRIRELM